MDPPTRTLEAMVVVQGVQGVQVVVLGGTCTRPRARQRRRRTQQPCRPTGWGTVAAWTLGTGGTWGLCRLLAGSTPQWSLGEEWMGRVQVLVLVVTAGMHK